MKKIIICLSILIIATNTKANASYIDAILGINTLLHGVTAISSSMNQIQQANTMKQMNTAINMRNQVYAQDMQNSGYSMQTIQVQNMEAIFKARQDKIYVVAARKKAKQEKDEEMLQLIKIYYHPTMPASVTLAKEKIEELLEQRKNQNL